VSVWPALGGVLDQRSDEPHSDRDCGLKDAPFNIPAIDPQSALVKGFSFPRTWLPWPLCTFGHREGSH
jgi:hypothetical protein